MDRTLKPDDEVNVVRGAVRHGRHPGTLDRALRNGELAFRWQDGRRLIRVADLDAWAARTDRGRSAVTPARTPELKTHLQANESPRPAA